MYPAPDTIARLPTRPRSITDSLLIREILWPRRATADSADDGVVGQLLPVGCVSPNRTCLNMNEKSSLHDSESNRALQGILSWPEPLWRCFVSQFQGH